MTVDELPGVILVTVTEADLIVAAPLGEPVRGDGLAIALRRVFPGFDWRSGTDIVHLVDGPVWDMDELTTAAVLHSVTSEPPDTRPFIARLTKQ